MASRPGEKRIQAFQQPRQRLSQFSVETNPSGFCAFFFFYCFCFYFDAHFIALLHWFGMDLRGQRPSEAENQSLFSLSPPSAVPFPLVWYLTILMANLLSWPLPPTSQTFFFSPRLLFRTGAISHCNLSPRPAWRHTSCPSLHLWQGDLAGLIGHLFLPSLPVGEMGEICSSVRPLCHSTGFTSSSSLINNPQFLTCVPTFIWSLLLFLAPALGWGGTKQIHTHFLSPNIGKRSFRDMQRVMGRNCKGKKIVLKKRNATSERQTSDASDTPVQV